MDDNVKVEWPQDGGDSLEIQGLEVALWGPGNSSNDAHRSSTASAAYEQQGYGGQGIYGGGHAYMHPAQASRPLAFPASNFSAPGEDSMRQLGVLQSKLAQRLGPEYLSTKPGPGGAGRLTYVEGAKIIDLANEVFGFNGWSCSIIKTEIDFVDEHPGPKFNVAVNAIVRVSLRDGTFHEDIGYGSADNLRSKAAALEKARKEAITDARKRALKNFGRLLGNCLYDKRYTDTVGKVKVAPEKYDVADMKRGPETSTSHQTHYQDGMPQAQQRRNHGDQAGAVRNVRTPAPPPPPAAANEVAQASTSAAAIGMNKSSVPAESSPSRPRTSSGKRRTPSPSTTRTMVGSAKKSDSEEAAREQRRAQAAARQAALRKKQMEQEAAQAKEAESKPPTAAAERAPLQQVSSQKRVSSPTQHTRATSQSSRKKVTPPQQASLSPPTEKTIPDEDLFLGDINFSQYSDDGLAKSSANVDDVGDDTTLVESAPVAPKKMTRSGRFESSPTSTKTRPPLKQEQGARSLVASQQRRGAMEANKRAQITSASHAYSNGHLPGEKRARYAPAR